MHGTLKKITLFLPIVITSLHGFESHALAQLSNLTLRVEGQSAVLHWNPVGDVEEYIVQGWSDLASTKYWVAQPATNYFQHVNVLNNYSSWFYQVQPVVFAPIYQPPAGTYFSAQTVTIKCSTAGAAIQFTTNGSFVTTNSPVYSAPINVDRSMTIRTLSAKAGYYPKAGYAQYTVLSPLVLWYPFNGNATDESGHKNDGVTFNVALCPDRSGTAASAYAFNGTNSSIQVSQESPFDLTELTVTAVVKMGAIPEQNESYCVISKGVGYGTFYLSLKRPSGGAWPPYAQLTYNHQTASGNFVTADYNTHLYTNQYYHVAFARTPTQIRLYVNGSLKTTTDYSVAPLMNNSDVLLGKGPDASWSNVMNGVIDNVRIFGRALSTADIQAVYSTDY